MYQGTWADALIIQAVADALEVTIQIVESNQGFAQLTTVNPVQKRNTLFMLPALNSELSFIVLVNNATDHKHFESYNISADCTKRHLSHKGILSHIT